jgi:hypothetical protein
MAGADRLGGGTGTPVVSQRSEAGQGILVAKSGRGKYDVLYDVVCKAVMSFMSSGCSLAYSDKSKKKSLKKLTNEVFSNRNQYLGAVSG